MGLHVLGLLVYCLSFPGAVVTAEDRPPLGDLGRVLRHHPAPVLQAAVLTQFFCYFCCSAAAAPEPPPHLPFPPPARDGYARRNSRSITGQRSVVATDLSELYVVGQTAQGAGGGGTTPGTPPGPRPPGRVPCSVSSGDVIRVPVFAWRLKSPSAEFDEDWASTHMMGTLGKHPEKERNLQLAVSGLVWAWLLIPRWSFAGSVVLSTPRQARAGLLPLLRAS